MDFLKKCFPISFKERTEVKQLVISVILQVLIGWGVAIVLGFVGGLLGALLSSLAALFIAVFGLLGSLISLYFTASIVFTFLSYFKVLK